LANRIVLTYRDNSNKMATSEHFIDDSEGLAYQEQGALAFALVVDNAIAARVSAASLVLDVDISGLTGNETPISGADSEEVGEFIFRTAEGRKAIMNLPGIEANAVGEGTDDLDQEDTGIAAIISAFEDGIAVTGGTVQPCDAGGDDLVAVVTARERVRNSGSRA
jgi:hypothetical protein